MSRQRLSRYSLRRINLRCHIILLSLRERQPPSASPNPSLSPRYSTTTQWTILPHAIMHTQYTLSTLRTLCSRNGRRDRPINNSIQKVPPRSRRRRRTRIPIRKVTQSSILHTSPTARSHLVAFDMAFATCNTIGYALALIPKPHGISCTG